MQTTTLSIPDGQATPVTHDLTRIRVSESGALWRSTEKNTLAGEMAFSIQYQQPSVKRPFFRVQGHFSMPIEVQDANTGMYLVASTEHFNFNAQVSSSLTVQQRKDLAAYAAALVAHSIVSSAIESGETEY